MARNEKPRTPASSGERVTSALPSDSVEESGLERLLGEGEVDAWILCLPEKESMPHPVFLRLDWRLRGAISRAIQAGALSRSPGDVSLLSHTRPVSDLGPRNFKILTVGTHDRKPVSAEDLSSLLRNVRGLRLKRVGLSASDFGWTESEAKRHFSSLKEAEVCVTE